MLNQTTLMGRLTADPELKTVNDNVSMVKFTLAVDRPIYGDREKQTDFIPIVAWRHTAEYANRNFRKGMQIYAVGRLETRFWDDENGQRHYGFNVTASELGFADSKKKEDGTGTPANEANQFSDSIPDDFDPFSDTPKDNLPA